LFTGHEAKLSQFVNQPQLAVTCPGTLHTPDRPPLVLGFFALEESVSFNRQPYDVVFVLVKAPVLYTRYLGMLS
jgi:hypothetical protein